MSTNLFVPVRSTGHLVRSAGCFIRRAECLVLRTTTSSTAYRRLVPKCWVLAA